MKGLTLNLILSRYLQSIPVSFTEKDIVGCQNNASQKNIKSPFLAA